MNEATKSRELSLDEWDKLLEPFGYADITTRQPLVMFRAPQSVLEYEIRMILKASPGGELGEWAERGYLLEQARQAVEAVKGAGFWLPDAPEITFNGRYMYRAGEPRPSWYAEAGLRFT